MQANRRSRLQTVMLEEVSRLVSREVKDPRVPALTFTKVEVTPDGGLATVFFTFFGALAEGPDGGPTPTEVKACLDGLKSAGGFLRKQLARILTIRQVPELVFKYDRGLENVSRVHELLREIAKPRSEEE